MLKRALKQGRAMPPSPLSYPLEAANAQTGIETLLEEAGLAHLAAHRLEAANAQTGIETPVAASAGSNCSH